MYCKNNCLQLRILIILLFLSQSVFSVESDRFTESESLSIEQLVDWVLENNPGHLELDAAVKEARSRVLPAASLDDPQLNYSIAPATIVGGSSNRFVQTIQLSQSIPWPGSLALQELQAIKLADMAQFHLEDHKLEIILAIKVAFAEYYYLHHAIEINKKNQNLLLELMRVAEAQYASGRSGQQDIIRAEMEHGMLKDHAFGLERAYASIRSQINALLNRKPQSPLPPPIGLTLAINPQDSETLQSIAFENHPQLMQFQANLDASRTSIGLAEKNFYPDFNVMAGYNNMWDNTKMRFMIGTSINLPIDKYKRRSQLDAAKAATSQAQWRLSDQRNLLLSRLEQSRLEVIESIRVIELYEQQLLPLARENYAVALAEYRSGTGPFNYVSDADANLLSIELRLLRARTDYFRSNATLNRWTGIPTDNHHQEKLP